MSIRSQQNWEQDVHIRHRIRIFENDLGINKYSQAQAEDSITFIIPGEYEKAKKVFYTQYNALTFLKIFFKNLDKNPNLSSSWDSYLETHIPRNFNPRRKEVPQEQRPEHLFSTKAEISYAYKSLFRQTDGKWNPYKVFELLQSIHIFEAMTSTTH